MARGLAKAHRLGIVRCDLKPVDRARAADLEQAAVVLASFLYDAAIRPDLLSRKPLPLRPAEAQPRHGGG